MRKSGAGGVGLIAVLVGVLGAPSTGCSGGVRTTAVPQPPPTPAAKKAIIRGLEPGTVATPEPNELLLDTNADPLYGEAPLIVRFSAAPFDKRDAKNPTYRWSFGDGSPDSTEQNPVHTYTRPGEYKVTVSVQAESGISGFDEFDLSVDEPTDD